MERISNFGGRRYPVITTAIYGLEVAQLDARTRPAENFDPVATLQVLGRRGHIAFEVHDNDSTLKEERWGQDAACERRSIRLRELS